MVDKQKTSIDSDGLSLNDLSVRQLLQLLADLRGLDKHAGWVYIKKVLQSQAEMKYSAIGRSPLRNVEQVLLAAELRGEAAAQEILCTLVEYLIALLEAQLQHLGVEEEDASD